MIYNFRIIELAIYNIVTGVNELNVEIEESHLWKVAGLMIEWEGPIADELNLKPQDVANIKAEYPKKLNLQK